jgi:hypothetical protein
MPAMKEPMRMGDQGVHRGIAKSSADRAMAATPKPIPEEPRVVFVVRIFARPAMSRSIESIQIRETLEKCCRQFGGGVGGKLSGTINGPADPFTQDQPAWGEFEYSPSCPP